MVSRIIIGNMAEGYQPDGSFGIEKAAISTWPSKLGMAHCIQPLKIFISGTAHCIQIRSFLKVYGIRCLLPIQVILDYGWFIDTQFNRQRIYFTGRSPGFTAYIGRYPAENICIIVLGNNYVPWLQILELTWPLFCSKKTDAPVLSNRRIDPLAAPELTGQYQFDSRFLLRICGWLSGRKKAGCSLIGENWSLPHHPGLSTGSIGRRCIS